MKKLLSAALAIIFVILYSGCAKKTSIASYSPDKSLISVDDDVIMTALDFQRVIIEQQVSADIKHTQILDEDELFIQTAEKYILSYFAEKFSIGYAKDQLYSEYDSHKEEISSGDIYATERLFSRTLQEKLGLDDASFREWAVSDSLLEYNVSLLLEDIANIYGNITDPVQMQEYIQNNIYSLFDAYDIELYHPRVKISNLTFASILNNY